MQGRGVHDVISACTQPRLLAPMLALLLAVIMHAAASDAVANKAAHRIHPASLKQPWCSNSCQAGSVLPATDAARCSVQLLAPRVRQAHQVTMDDPVVVQVGHAAQQLLHQTLDLQGRQVRSVSCCSCCR